MEDTGQAKVTFVKLEDNAADIYTKNTDGVTLRRHRERIRTGKTYSWINWKDIVKEVDGDEIPT